MLQCAELKPAIPASHTGTQVQVLASPLLIQLPAVACGKVVDDGPSTWKLLPMSFTQIKFRAPGFGLVQLLIICLLLGSEPVDERCSLSLLLYPLNKDINIYKMKRRY